jgi:RNA polymerase sigma factor (sigma-70 family)
MAVNPALPVEMASVKDFLHIAQEPAKVIVIGAAAAANQEAVYLQLYRDYYGHIKKYTVLYLHVHEELADDIVQNIFLKLWERKEKLHLILSPDKYLFEMARNLFLQNCNRQRNRGRVFRNIEWTLDGRDDSTDQEILYRDTRRILESVMQRLPSRIRRTYMMKKNGYKIKEIASVMGIGEQTVKNNLQTAYKRMEGVREEMELVVRKPGAERLN